MYASWIFMKSNHSGNFWDFWASLHYFPERPRPVQAHTFALYVRKSLSCRGKTLSSYWLKSLPAKAFRTNSFAPRLATIPHFKVHCWKLGTRYDSQIWRRVYRAQSGAELWPPEVARCHWPMVQADWTYGRFVVKWLLQRMAGLRPGEAPDVPTPDLFPLTLYYRWGWRLYDCIKELRSYCRSKSMDSVQFFCTHEQVLNLPQW